jgi:uncharacterized protein YdaU (DUF1376 family)
MPLYVGDYLADTGHLTTLEHGAYLLLIMTYWRKGGLPDDDAQLARIVRMTADEWFNVRSTIVQLFSNGWRHKRIDAELERSVEKAKKASFAGKRSAEARSAQQAFNGRSTDEPTEGQPSQPQSQSQLEASASNKSARGASSNAFLRFWGYWPNKVGRPAAERAFGKLDGEIDAILAGLDRYVREKPPDRPWLNPSTFLNQRRWEDSPAPVIPGGSNVRQSNGNRLLAAFDKLEERLRPVDSGEIRPSNAGLLSVYRPD